MSYKLPWTCDYGIHQRSEIFCPLQSPQSSLPTCTLPHTTRLICAISTKTLQEQLRRAATMKTSVLVLVSALALAFANPAPEAEADAVAQPFIENVVGLDFAKRDPEAAPEAAPAPAPIAAPEADAGPEPEAMAELEKRSPGWGHHGWGNPWKYGHHGWGHGWGHGWNRWNRWNRWGHGWNRWNRWNRWGNWGHWW